MIISHILGGLGNQMFQYAAGRALSLRIGQPLRLDISSYSRYSLHQGFELDRVFCCPVSLAEKNDLQTVLGWQSRRLLRRNLSRRPLAWLRRRNFIVEPHFHYWSEFSNLSGSCYLVGYWQSEKYFKKYAEILRADFRFKAPLANENAILAEKMDSTNAVSLHVRRGDYVTNPVAARVHGVCSLEYYQRAIAWMIEHVNDPQFFVFADDIEWARKNLAIRQPCEFVEHNRGRQSYVDMQLMSRCKHHIIANSTFSWWGAWLNPNPDKIVIAPRQWFRVSTFDTRDLYPSEWMVL